MQADLDSVTRIVSALVRGMKNNGTILRYDSPDDYATVVGDRGVSDARGIAAEVAATCAAGCPRSRLGAKALATRTWRSACSPASTSISST